MTEQTTQQTTQQTADPSTTTAEPTEHPTTTTDELARANENSGDIASTEQVAAVRPDGDQADATTDSPTDRAPLLAQDEADSITQRWREIQAGFVDEPQRAVRDADALVAELMQRLAAMFAEKRSELEAQWSGGNNVSTEELRQGLQRYRDFFERLLAA
jgi:hypothetical protein